tara:strand:- start:411 stop:668 length:258 start_codon:yes stop_codon:yes gene_type:complete
MDIMTQKDTDNFMAAKPYELDRVINHLGQEVIFYEDPITDHFVYCYIEKNLAMTGFFETDDFLVEDSDYMPILVNGEIGFRFELK